MARFAVQNLAKIEDFMANSPDMGEVAQKAAALRGKQNIFNTGLGRDMAVAKIQGDVARETGQVMGAAESAAGKSRMWGSIFNTGLSVAGGGMNAYAKANNIGIYTPKGGSSFESFVPGTDRYFYQDADGGIYPTP